MKGNVNIPCNYNKITNNERSEAAVKDALANASSILSSFNDPQGSFHEDMSQIIFRPYCIVEFYA